MEAILDIFSLLLLSLIPACFNFFLDYTLGHPMSDNVSSKAIFFRYAYWLAKRKISASALQTLTDYYSPMINSTDPAQARDGKSQFQVAVVMQGRESFYWEQPIGMCPFCTNFWIALFVSFIVYFTIPFSVVDPIFTLLIIPVFSHAILRKL